MNTTEHRESDKKLSTKKVISLKSQSILIKPAASTSDVDSQEPINIGTLIDATRLATPRSMPWSQQHLLDGQGVSSFNNLNTHEGTPKNDIPSLGELVIEKGSGTPVRKLSDRTSNYASYSDVSQNNEEEQPIRRVGNLTFTRLAGMPRENRGIYDLELSPIPENANITGIELTTNNFTQRRNELDRQGHDNLPIAEESRQDLEANPNRGGHPVTPAAGPANPNNTVQQAQNVESNIIRLQPVQLTASIRPFPIHRTNPSLRVYYQPEVKIYLAKVIGFLLSVSLFSVGFLLMRYNICNMDFMVVVVDLFLVFLGAMDILWKRRMLQEVFIVSDDIFYLIDTCSAILSFFWVYLKLSGAVPLSTYACVPLLLSFLLYLMSSKAPAGVKTWRCILRAAYVAQVLLLSYKLDTYDDMSWQAALLLCWVYLGIRVIQTLKYGYYLFHSIRIAIAQPSPNNKTRIIGFTWFVLYYGMSIIFILALLGVAKAYDPTEDFTLLTTVAFISIGAGVGLLVYTILAWKRLNKLIEMYGLIECLRVQYELSKARNIKKISIQSEQKENYFVMLSSTYFLPLQKTLISKSKDGILAVKKMIMNLKLGKADEKSQNDKSKEALDVNALKQFKKSIEGKFQKIGEIKWINKQNKPLVDLNSATHMRKQGDKLSSEGDNVDLNVKLSLSVDNINEFRKHHEKAASPSPTLKEERLCYICYANVPNAILLNCGHGGFCYECAATSIMKKDECMECRGKVDGIYRIEPNPKFANIIKGVELNKVIVSTGQRE